MERSLFGMWFNGKYLFVHPIVEHPFAMDLYRAMNLACQRMRDESIQKDNHPYEWQIR